jgi:uncharacterized membrane protein YccF (DUF307 family)
VRTVGNVLWLVLAGIWLAFAYAFAGLLMCITIIGIPFGIQAFKLAGAVMAPFGKRVEEGERATGCTSVTLNVIWILLPGLELAITHLVLAALLGITLVGIPFALQHVKLIPLALMPFGRTIVPVERRPGA